MFRRLVFCQFAFIDQLQKKIFITISITSTLQIVIIVIPVAVLFEQLNCFFRERGMLTTRTPANLSVVSLKRSRFACVSLDS